jgi:Cu/Ag efflux pump CusA
VLLGGADFQLGSLLGTLAILALAVRQGIGLVRHFQALELRGVEFGEELVRRGVRERFPGIVTSVLVTALAVLPFVVIGDVAGLEVLHSAAAVVLGGMVSVLMLTLLCIPATYVRFGARTAQDTLGLAPDPAAWAATPVHQPGKV